jgi:hypothetical protein
MRALLRILQRPLPISDDAIETAALAAFFPTWWLLCHFGLVSGGGA